MSNILLDKKTVDEITIYFDYFRDKDLRNTLNMSCIKKDIYQDYNYKLYELKDNINSSVYNDNDDKNHDLIEEINYNDCTNNILIDYYNKLSDNSNNDDHNNYNFINLKIKKKYKLVLSTNNDSVEFLLSINNYLNYNKIFTPKEIYKNLTENFYTVNSVIPISNLLDTNNYYYTSIYINKSKNMFIYSDDIRLYKALFIS